MKQHSIKEPVSATGIGVHSGKKTTITLLPAPENTGIVFIRNKISIKATVNNVSNTLMATTIGEGENSVTMVEHLMSACAGMTIDNLYIWCSEKEMPIFDGSATTYCHLIKSAGIRKQNATRMYLRVTDSFTVESNGAKMTLHPYSKHLIDFNMTTTHPAFKNNHSYKYNLKKNYEDVIAPARTFGYTKDLAQLNSINLAKGASDENCLPLDDYKTTIPKRFPNEMIRHKVLDVIGDFYLLGYPFIGKIECKDSGHKTNNKAIKYMLDNGLYQIYKKRF